jgi:hypothetical protein
MENMLVTYTHKYAQLFPGLNERAKRLVAASDAKMIEYGGITLVHKASGLDPKTIRAGIKELEAQDNNTMPPDRCRRPGGGRKNLTYTDKTLLDDLHDLVADSSRGDPESPLQWTNKSTRTLATELTQHGHAVSHTRVGTLLKESGYSLQSNRKIKEGTDHPDRDEQLVLAIRSSLSIPKRKN